MKKSSDKKKDKLKIPRPKKVKLDISKLPDAIVDGIFTVPVGQTVIIPKEIDGKRILCKCTVKNVNADGTVYTWDETTVRWVTFKVTDPIVVKIDPGAPL